VLSQHTFSNYENYTQNHFTSHRIDQPVLAGTPS